MDRPNKAHTFITAAIMTMALLITLLVSQTTWHALEEYRSASDSAVAGEISIHLVRASGTQALERGFTSGVLASRTLPDAQLVEIIQQLRQSGDEHQKKAFALAQKFIEKHPDDFALKVGLQHEVDAENSLREARKLVDRQFNGERQLITPQEWFNEMTYMIGHNKHFRDALSSSVLEAPIVSRPYWTIRHWAWRISENAGRERGTLAINVAGNSPLSRDTLEQLNGFRAIVEHELEMLSSTKMESSVDGRLVRAIEEMEALFFEEYETTRGSVYAAGDTGDYPLSRDQWLATATTAINSILNVSEVSSQIIHEVVISTRESKLLITKLYLLLLGFTIVLVVLAIRKVKQSAKALVQSKEFAEKTAEVLETEVNERRYLEQSLRSSQEGFRSLVMQNPTGIVVVNSVGEGLFSNLAAQKMLKRTEEQFKTEGIQIPLLIGCQREVNIICADGSQGKAEARISETVWNDSPSTLILLNDISERKAAQNEIEHISYHDALTGLPNRLLFSDRVKHAVARAKRDKTMLALLFVDIDDFKVINDTLGSAVGDELLRQVASRLSDCVREEDTVARMGGDEYAILLESVKHLDHVKAVSEKIETTSSGQFDISDHKQHLSVCIGSSVFPVDTEDPDTLIRQAHAAMFHAKEEGRGKTRSYIEDMSLRFSLRLQLENRLRKAVENEEFVLHYQPQVNLHDNRIIGVEALLRWQCPERGLVYPVEFVSTLEETGLIVSVGRWVLHTACSQNKRWQDAGLDHITMAVNVSPIQFSSHQMTDTIIEVLAETGLPPCSLELEITENALMNHPAHCAFMLRELKVLGVNTSIDDFGTGYSSLSYLKRFPVSKLKIDRSFISDLPHDANDASITKAILGLGNSLQLDVLAEGVETKAQLKFLKKHGCEEVQGYYFSRPIPADELTILLEKQSSESVVI